MLYAIIALFRLNPSEYYRDLLAIQQQGGAPHRQPVKKDPLQIARAQIKPSPHWLQLKALLGVLVS